MAPLVVIVDSKDGAPRRIEVERSPVRIGRGAENEVQIPLAFVSERHGQLRFDGNRVEYIDLGSTNGSFLGAARLAPHVPVRVDGAVELSIGAVRLWVERPAEQAADLLPDRPSPELAAAQTVAAPEPPPPEPPVVEPPEPRAGPAAQQHSIYNPPTIIPSSFEDRPSPASRPRNAKIAGLPTIFPSMPELPPAPPVPAPEPIRPERTDRLAGEIKVPEQAPTRSQALPAQPSKPQHQPTPRPTDSRAEVAESADLRAIASALCDELMKLRAATEAFGREAGIRTFSQSERSRLHDLRDGAELLRYLTSGATRTARLQEVRALFGDLVTHHLAMMGAIVEGARATLGRVDPQEFSAGKGRRRLPFLDGNRWEEYLEHFRNVQQDDQVIQEAVFGSEFAEAYAAARSK